MKQTDPKWPNEAGVKTFAQEYVIDFNPVNAVYRSNLRGCRKTAKKIAQELLERADVQIQIRKLLDKSEESCLVTKSRVESALWKEANNLIENGSARVAALTQLCRVKGYHHENERELTLKGKSPVINLKLDGADEDDHPIM